MCKKMKGLIVGLAIGISLCSTSLKVEASDVNTKYEEMLNQIEVNPSIVKKDLNKGEMLRFLKLEYKEEKAKELELKKQNELLKKQIQEKREAERRRKEEEARKRAEEEAKRKEEEKVAAEKKAAAAKANSANIKVNGNKRLLGTFQATAYDDSYQSQGKWQGKTATGRKPQRGVIAVDPRVIPLNTKLYIESTDGTADYGYAVAGDTGGAIKGNRVDLFHNTPAECRKFGRRNVKVYIID